MADIYSSASRVNVWHGSQSHGSTQAIKCCEEISSHIMVDWDLRAMVPRSTSIDLSWVDGDEGLPFTDVETIAICNFINPDWLMCLWIRQVSHSYYWFGRCMWLMQHVLEECSRCYLQLSRQTTVSNLHQFDAPSRRETLYSLCRGKRSSKTEQLIFYTKDCICSDQRDTPYALFSLLREVDKILVIEPKYPQSSVEIFRRFNQDYIQSTKSLQLYGTARPAAPNTLPGTRILSRSDDWAVWCCKASGFSEAVAIFREDGSTEVIGITTRTIEKIEAFKPSMMSTVKLNASELQIITCDLRIHSSLIDSSEKLRAYCRVLIGNESS